MKHARQETVDQFTKTVRAWVVQHAPEPAEKHAKKAARSERFSIFPSEGGYRLAGWIDAINGLQLDKTMRALVGVPARGDARTHGQRYADVLTALVIQRPDQRAGPSASGSGGPSGGGSEKGAGKAVVKGIGGADAGETDFTDAHNYALADSIQVSPT